MRGLLCVSGKLGCCSLFRVDACKDQASALSHTHMWGFLCSKSFYRFILTNFVECFGFFFSIPNLKLMLQTVSRCSTWGHKSVFSIFAQQWHDQARVYRIIYFAFATGTRELIDKRNPLLLLLFLEVDAFVCREKWNWGKAFWIAAVLCCSCVVAHVWKSKARTGVFKNVFVKGFTPWGLITTIGLFSFSFHSSHN